ncbi:MAG TPA: AraC family transcriptional regulator [Chitinophagaceae bacterium]
MHKYLLSEISKENYDSGLIHIYVNEILDLSLNKHSVRCYSPAHQHMEKYIPVIDRAKDFILTHFDTDIILNDVSQHAMMSPFHLLRIFKCIMNYSPHSYIRKVRLKNGQLLLRTTNLSIADISLRSGFNRPDYFATAFAKEYGMAPNRFRKSHAITAPHSKRLIASLQPL